MILDSRFSIPLTTYTHAQLWLVEYKSRVGSKDVRRMARDSLQLGVYALAVRRLLGRAPTRLMIESIEDGRIGAFVGDWLGWCWFKRSGLME